MKRLILFSLIFTIASGFAFAQLRWMARGSAAFSPMTWISDGDSETKDEVYVGVGRHDTLGHAWVVMDLEGNNSARTLGFRAMIYFNGVAATSGSVGPVVGDFASIWAKPLNWLRLEVGKYNYDFFRGKIPDSIFDDFGIRALGNDEIFTRFQGSDAAHLAITLPFVPGLQIGAELNGLGGLGFWTSTGTNQFSGDRAGILLKDAVKYRCHYVIGYTIPSFGLARIGYIGRQTNFVFNTATPMPNTPSAMLNVTSSRFEAAFAYIGTRDFVVDVGVKIPVAFEKVLSDLEYDIVQRPLQFSGGATWKYRQFTFLGRVDTKFLGKVQRDSKSNIGYIIGPEANILLVPAYDFTKIVVGADIGLGFYGDSKITTGKIYEGGTRVGLGFWVRKNLGNGAVQAGVSYRLPAKMYGEKEPSILSLPVVITYSL